MVYRLIGVFLSMPFREELADGSIESETDATTTLTKEAVLGKV